MKLHISDGNSKLGKIPNFSMLPLLTCPADVPCAKVCYALNSCTAWNNVVPAWADNTMHWKHRPQRFWGDMHAWFDKRRKNGGPKYFRWFVGGDIPSLEFLRGMIELANVNPQTQFRSFTKNACAMSMYMTERRHGRVDRNLRIGFSAWPWWHYDDTYRFHIHHADIGFFNPESNENRDEGMDYLMEGARTCPGSCKNCKYCWTTSTKPVRVIFNEH